MGEQDSVFYVIPVALDDPADPRDAVFELFRIQLHQSVLEEEAAKNADVSDFLVVESGICALIQFPVLKQLIMIPMNEEPRPRVPERALELVVELLEHPRLGHVADHQVEVEGKAGLELPNAPANGVLVGCDQDLGDFGRDRHVHGCAVGGRAEAEVLEGDEYVVYPRLREIVACREREQPGVVDVVGSRVEGLRNPVF